MSTSNTDPRPLTGRLALVTGASRGLGRAVALRLGGAGAEVIAVARTTGGLEELDDAIRDAGGPRATLVPADVTDDGALARLGAAIHARWGRLDLLVHAAANAPPLAPVEHVEAKDLDAAFAVNARATQRLIRVADPLLRLSGAPRAVFFDDAVNTGRLHAAYAASKAAARVFVESWRDETRSFGLDIRLLAPPAMPTAVRGRFRPGEPRESLMRPEDAAAALLPEIAPEACKA